MGLVIHNIIKLTTLNDYELLATFEDGKRKKYDMKPWIDEISMFKPLKTIKGLFEKAHLSPGGYAIIWNNQIDMDAYVIYNEGIDI